MGTYVYVPSTSGESMQIFGMDPSSGRLTKRDEFSLGRPGCPVCTDPERRFLYVGVWEGESAGILSFKIDPESGGLTRIGDVPLEGNACYLSTDRSGRYVLASYYLGGMATTHRVGDDGALMEPQVDRHVTEQGAHWIGADASNSVVFVPHVAKANSIYQFRFDTDSGRLTPNVGTPRLACRDGYGPRHMAWHPRLDVVYADNEQDSSVSVYRIDRGNGTLAEEQTVSTLPPEGHEGNSNAQIAIHPGGRFIYASNRGHDTIAMFAIDETTGHISAIGRQPSEKVPRCLGIEPEGRFLFAAGDESDRLVSYAIGGDGVLQPTGDAHELGCSPGWVLPVKVG